MSNYNFLKAKKLNIDSHATDTRSYISLWRHKSHIKIVLSLSLQDLLFGLSVRGESKALCSPWSQPSEVLSVGALWQNGNISSQNLVLFWILHHWHNTFSNEFCALVTSHCTKHLTTSEGRSWTALAEDSEQGPDFHTQKCSCCFFKTLLCWSTSQAWAPGTSGVLSPPHQSSSKALLTPPGKNKSATNPEVCRNMLFTSANCHEK